MADVRTRHPLDGAAAEPRLEGELEILAAPNAEARIVGAELEEVLPVHREQAAGVRRRAVRVRRRAVPPHHSRHLVVGLLKADTNAKRRRRCEIRQ